MKKISFAILANEVSEDHSLWVKACGEMSDEIDYEVIELTKSDWWENLNSKPFDMLVAKPPGLTAKYKQLYDERIQIIDTVLKLPLYPTAAEIYLHENKRYLYSWLKANRLTHPETHIIYNVKEALNIINDTKYPLVAKVNIGASGRGTKILQNRHEAEEYINRTFSNKGAPQRWGPNFSSGHLIRRGIRLLLNPAEVKKRKEKYQAIKNNVQEGFVILQKYIPHNYEWRIVVIGDSYFAHKKMKTGEKASGSLVKNYDNPPLRIFDFARDIVKKYNFESQAIDAFETSDGKLLINEMQCIFGQSDPYQMLVDGKPGRYRYKENRWVFEEGDFTRNECFNLRVEHVLSQFKAVTEDTFR